MAESSSESEELLNLDENGRCAIGGRVDLTTRCFDRVLDVSTSLLADTSASFSARAKGSKDELSAGCTFWVPANAKPTTSIEQLALDVFRFHAQDALYDQTNSGAEWWTQVIGDCDEIGLHWDRDCEWSHATASPSSQI